jgi:hypothetical protein
MRKEQREVLYNYLLLIAALALPMAAFYLFATWVLSLCSVLSIGLIWLVARRTRLKEDDAKSGVRLHLRIQRWVLLVILLGGIFSALQVFLAGEQLRGRFNFTTFLWALTWLLWSACAVLSVGGCAALLIRSKAPDSRRVQRRA